MSRSVSCELSSLVELSRKLIGLYRDLESIQKSDGIASSGMLGRLGFSTGESGVYPSALKQVAAERMSAIASEIRLAAETLVFKQIDEVVVQMQGLSSHIASGPQLGIKTPNIVNSGSGKVGF